MKFKSILLKSFLFLLIINVVSCSSDSNSDDEVIITVNTSNFSTSINENPSNGTVLGTVQGSTNQGSVSFSITEQNPSGAIAIDGSTGQLTVANGLLFSFGTHPSITGTVKVANGSIFENAAITITVNETVITVNTSDFSTSMDENPSSGALIGTIEGSTNLGEVSFSISEQTPMDAMEIDPVTGELTVLDVTVFDYETNETITAIVKVENGAVFEESTVTIDINDVDEENIFYGDIILLTQEELDDFGSNNYTAISGSIYIGYYTEQDNKSITNLNALSALTAIGNRLYIAHNELLPSLEGLNNVNALGGYLRIRKNDNLTDMSALSNIQVVPGDLIVVENDNLTNLEGLNNITSVGEDGLFIQSNPSLINIDGLQNITSVEGNILIENNESLQNIDGLSGIESANDLFFITDNNSLTSIEGLINLNSAIGLSISRNPLLTNLQGINNLTSVENLSISDNDLLTHINELQNLTYLERLFITENNSLTNIDGVSNIPSQLTEVNIYYNDNLTNLNGLSNITTITDKFTLVLNNSLSALDGVSSLQTLEDLEIRYNSALINLCGLENLIVGGGLTDEYVVENNAYNPTQQDIIDGNCSL